MILVRPLTPQEVEDLRAFMRATRDARLLKRAQMIWLSHQGWTVPEIADALDVSPETVREWIRRYEEQGLDGLRDEDREGRPRKASTLYVRTLLDLVPRSPRTLGLPAHRWTLDLLVVHLERETGIGLSRERVRQVLLEHHVRFTRPKLHVESADPEYDAKIQAIHEALREATPDTVILFEDESDFHLNPRILPAWQEARARIPSAGAANHRLYVFGALDIRTGRVHQRICKRKTNREFTRFLQQIAHSHPQEPILLILDNYAIHATKRVQKLLDHLNGRIRLLFLPTYSPQLNPIEGWWRHEKDRVLANVFHGTLDGLRRAIRAWHRAHETGRVPTYHAMLPQKWEGLC